MLCSRKHYSTYASVGMRAIQIVTALKNKVNGGNSGQWVTPDSDSSCSESAAADAPAGGKASPPPHEASLTGGGVGGGRFAARTVAVRSYPLSGVPPIYLNAQRTILPDRQHNKLSTPTGRAAQHSNEKKKR